MCYVGVLYLLGLEVPLIGDRELLVVENVCLGVGLQRCKIVES